MRKIIFILISVIGISFAQKNSLEGIVLHKETKATLSEAKVVLFENNQMVKSAKTDFNGAFSIPIKAGKEYLLKVSKVSYEEQIIKFVADKPFFENLPFTIQLPSLKSEPNLSNVQDGMDKKVPNSDIAEDIGDLSNLPPGSKILDVKAVELEEQPAKHKFNVNKNKKNKNTLDTELIKSTFNQANVEKTMYSKEEAFPSSYVAESSVFYDAGKVALPIKVQEFLDGIVNMVSENPGSKIKLVAYADGLQEAKVADFLSKKRAEEISKYLETQSVNFDQMEIIIKGNSELENGCYPNVECDEFQHQENRRVDLIFIR
jgi:outer membrane protein OmpA-like peptidoglycan-associated protein